VKSEVRRSNRAKVRALALEQGRHGLEGGSSKGEETVSLLEAFPGVLATGKLAAGCKSTEMPAYAKPAVNLGHR
jgi:hypothetical protein